MIRIYDSEDEVADEIAKELKAHSIIDEYPVFCLASGTTPQKSYRQFAELIDNDERIKKLKFVSLDEWVGIERASEGSCYQMLNQDLFSLLSMENSQVEFFDRMSSDLQQECARIDRFIDQHPITFCDDR